MTDIIVHERGTLAFRLIYYILDIIEALILIRFLLRLVQANPAAGFVQFIYGLTAPFVDPFLGIVPTTFVSGYPIEWASIVAMVAWAVLFAVIARLIRILLYS